MNSAEFALVTLSISPRFPVMTALVAMMLMAACAANVDSGPQVDDPALAASIHQALDRDSELSDAHITVGVRGGEVKLTGVVHSQRLRDRATDVVGNVAGVRRVNNLLGLE